MSRQRCPFFCFPFRSKPFELSFAPLRASNYPFPTPSIAHTHTHLKRGINGRHDARRVATRSTPLATKGTPPHFRVTPPHTFLQDTSQLLAQSIRHTSINATWSLTHQFSAAMDRIPNKKVCHIFRSFFWPSSPILLLLHSPNTED